jgi:hypothetical protein
VGRGGEQDQQRSDGRKQNQEAADTRRGGGLGLNVLVMGVLFSSRGDGGLVCREKALRWLYKNS